MSNHVGPASLYARKPLARDMLGMYFAVGNANHHAGRTRHAALHQSDRRRDSRWQARADRARHDDDRRGVWQRKAKQRAARRCPKAG
jgi:hypothetical protein